MSTSDYTDRARSAWLALHPDQDMVGFDIAMRVRRLATILEDRLEIFANAHGFQAFGDYEAAAALRRSDQPVLPSDLATHLKITRAGVTGRINRLAAAGVITRAPNNADRRSVHLSLTALGRRRVDKTFVDLQHERRNFLEPLTADRQADLADLLSKVLAPLDPPVGSPP